MPPSDPILKCNTARQRLKETRDWLNELLKPEIFNDTEAYDRHLFAFCESFASTIDYVHSDFVYHKVKFEDEQGRFRSIDWKKFSRSRKDQEEIIESHPEKKALKKFRGEYKNKKDILLRNPLVNYFYNKRQEFTHIRWSGSKWGAYSGQPGNEHYSERGLENSYLFEVHKKHPNDSLPMFDDYIPIQEQLETLKILTDHEFNIKDIGNQLCDEVEKFIDYFEGKDYFSES